MTAGAHRDAGYCPRPGHTGGHLPRPLRVPGLLECFGVYTVREWLGEGGSCAVFAAEHPGLRVPLAVKVLHRKLVSDPATARRMIDEASMIATLNHPGIVEVYDHGYSTDGRPFVVLERLVGESLSDRLRRGRLSEGRIVIFAQQLAAAPAGPARGRAGPGCRSADSSSPPSSPPPRSTPRIAAASSTAISSRPTSTSS